MAANGGPPRRRIWEEHDTALQARQGQASKDALKRQHKVKKSRIVKRHVLYKQKRNLLQNLAKEAIPKPIVAEELGRPGEEFDDMPNPTDVADSKMPAGETEADGNVKNAEKNSNDHAENFMPSEGAEIDGNPAAFGEGRNDAELRPASEFNAGKKPVAVVDGEGHSKAQTGVERQRSQQKGASEGLKGKQLGLKNDGQRGKYVPYAKQIREYEALKKQREEEERVHQENIKKREEMLKASKKRRRQRVCTLLLLPLPLILGCASHKHIQWNGWM